MKITTFMQALMPTFSRDTLETELEDLQKNINEINIPFLEAAMKNLAKYKFKSEFAEKLEEALVDDAKVKRFVNFLGSFLEISKVMREQLPVIERLVDEHFEYDVSVHAMNLQRVNLLQYIPVMNFICTYMRTFTNYAVGLEINAASDSTDAVYDLKPGDRDWIARHRQAFIDSVRAVYNRGKNLEKIFEAIPDVSIDPSNAKLVEHNLGGKSDPLELGIIPLAINPIFFIRKVVMNYQVTRYHLAVEERLMLERKLHNLRMISEGRNDAKLQEQICYLEEKRIVPLKQKIANWEQEYVTNA